MFSRDSHDLDFRPVTRRRSGGLAMRASMLACSGSIGSPESQSQSVSNEQTTVQGATGATTVALGAGSQGSVTINTLDAAVANNAIDAQAQTVNNALEANTAALAGAETVANNAITANAASTASFFQFGSETVNNALAFAGNTIGDIESSNAQLQAVNEQTIGSLSNQLGQITANAAPQTAAAQQEILSGTTPTGEAAQQGTDWTSVAIVGGLVLSFFVFIRSGGKAA
jgi:hypothetical protein